MGKVIELKDVSTGNRRGNFLWQDWTSKMDEQMSKGEPKPVFAPPFDFPAGSLIELTYGGVRDLAAVLHHSWRAPSGERHIDLMFNFTTLGHANQLPSFALQESMTPKMLHASLQDFAEDERYRAYFKPAILATQGEGDALVAARAAFAAAGKELATTEAAMLLMIKEIQGLDASRKQVIDARLASRLKAD